MTDNAKTIRDNAADPKRASSDGQSVEQHSIQDQIDADRYYEAKKAARQTTGWGFRVARIKPGGTT